MPKEKKPIELWAETVEWIHQTWMRKKGRKYPFMARDFNQLKLLRRYFTAPEVMALWDSYLEASPFFGSKTGYLISGFWEERSILLESAPFKNRLAMHEKRLGLAEPKGVPLVNDLAQQKAWGGGR
jgi:hypothetical protein